MESFKTLENNISNQETDTINLPFSWPNKDDLDESKNKDGGDLEEKLRRLLNISGGSKTEAEASTDPPVEQPNEQQEAKLGTLHYKDGSVYKGAVLGNERHGYGRMNRENQSGVTEWT